MFMLAVYGYLYKVSHLGWVDLNLEFYNICPILCLLIRNLAEPAVQLGKMVEHLNQSQPNQGLRADGTPCMLEVSSPWR